MYQDPVSKMKEKQGVFLRNSCRSGFAHAGDCKERQMIASMQCYLPWKPCRKGYKPSEGYAKPFQSVHDYELRSVHELVPGFLPCAQSTPGMERDSQFCAEWSSGRPM